MLYINPFELLEIAAENLSDVDSASINKAKRKLMAEIELSDTNTIVHSGVELNKGDCIKAIDDLDNRDKKEFHFFIYQHKHLKRFLTKGKLSFFENYQAESIYKLPEFLDFISKYFAEQYDKILLENYKQWNHDAVAKILSVKPITNETYYEKCYNSTYAFIKEIDSEINSITKDIANNKSPFISKKFNGLDKEIIEKVNVPLLNLLPSYFQSLRNQLALSIRNLARDINNEPHLLYEPAFKVIDIANNISTDALTKQTILKGYYTIKKNYDDDLSKLQPQNNSTADSQLRSWWGKKANQIETITKEIEDGESKFISSQFFSLDKVVYEIADPSKLNSLSSGFQSVRNQVASNVRSLAVTVNNEPHKKYKVAYDLISIANSIKADGDIAEKISSAYQVIKGNFDKQVGQEQTTSKSQYDIPYQEPVTEEKKEAEAENKTNWGYRIFMGIFCGIMVWALFNSTVKIVILSLSALFFAMRIYNMLKKPEDFKKNTVADSFFFFLSAATCVGGFFYLPLALIYISYNLIVWGHQWLYDVFLNKPYRNERSIGYLLIALLISFSILAFQKSNNENSTNPIVSTTTSGENVEQPVNEKDFFQQGQQLFNERNFSEAIKRYNEAIKLNPKFADAFLARGASQANMGQYENAIADYDSAITLGYNQALVYSNLGIAYYQLHKPEEANKYFNTAIKTDATYAYAYKGRGDIKYDKNDNSGAIADYTQAIKYNPNNSSFYFARGLAYYYLHNYKTAVTDINKAIDLNPNNAQYYYDRGDAKDQLNDFAGACNDWNTAKQKGYSVPEYKIDRCTPKVVYVPNGNIEGCGKYKSVYANPSIENSLKISVGNNTNVAAKLINYSNNKCYRYVFVQRNSTYTMRNIPEGKYYLKIAYGYDWTVMGNQNNCEGKFTRDVLYKKSTQTFDFNLVRTNSGVQIPYFELDLNVVTTTGADNTFNSSQINANDFYNE